MKIGRAIGAIAFVVFLVLIFLSAWGVGTSATLYSKRTPLQIVTCLTKDDASFVDVSDLPNGAKQADIGNGRHATIATYRIYPEASGSRVEFHRDLLAMISSNY